MDCLDKIKDWIIEHKKLVITLLIVIAILVIFYHYKDKNYYLSYIYSYICPVNTLSEPPMVPTETGSYESLPQLYI